MSPVEDNAPKGPPLTDLRSITRDSKRCETRVILQLDWRTKSEWLVFGQAQLRAQRESQPDGRFRLEARMTEGVTDFEHDSAYALKLPLIGVQFSSMLVHYHQTHLIGWVDPDAEDMDFMVPNPGYNPMKHKDAHVCKDKSCLKENPKGHIIVPQGFYVPPPNPALYKLVRGKRVEIIIGLVVKENK